MYLYTHMQLHTHVHPHINIMHTYPSEDSPKTSPLFESVYRFQVLSLCLMPKPWPHCDVLLWPTLPYWVFAACNILLKEVGRHLGRFRGSFLHYWAIFQINGISESKSQMSGLEYLCWPLAQVNILLCQVSWSPLQCQQYAKRTC